MGALRGFLRSPARHRGAATAVEYAMIAALIAVPIAVATLSVGKELSGMINNIGAELVGVPDRTRSALSLITPR